MFNPFIENLDELSDDNDHVQEQGNRMRKRQQEELEKGDGDTGKVIKIE